MTEQEYENTQEQRMNDHQDRINTHSQTANRWFSTLYRTRVKVQKGSVTIVNLSLIFSLLALLSAPWLVVIGFLVALALGYRFSMERNAPAFSGDFQQVVRGAAANVKSAVDSVVKNADDAE